jgi:hypothetical protein
VAKIGIERELIFCMIAGESGAERRLVLTSLSRNIVGGGRQRWGRLIKLCGVPGGGFAVVAEIGIERELIFCMVADGSGAERPRVLSSILGRDIVGSGRQRGRRLIKLCLVPSVGFANAVMARVGIFSMVTDESGAGRPRVLSTLRRDIVGG